MQISEKNNKSIGFKILILLPLILLLYFIMIQYNSVGMLSVAIQKPYSLKTIVDDWIPFIPWFLIPYLLWTLFPLAGLIFSFHKKITAINIISLYIVHILLALSCFVIYLVFPTTAISVMVDTSLFDYNLFPSMGALQKIYNAGVPYNAFPSYHVASVMFIVVFLFYKWRSLFWFHLPLAIVIIIATVFIKFHFFVDILGGIAMGVFAYYILYEKIVLKKMNKLVQIK